MRTFAMESVDTHSCPCWPGPFTGARRRRPCRCKPLYTEYRLPWSLAKLKQKKSICVQQRNAIFHPSVLQLHCIKFTCPDILQAPGKAASPPSVVSWPQWPLWSRCYDNLYLHVTSIPFKFGSLAGDLIPSDLNSWLFPHRKKQSHLPRQQHSSSQRFLVPLPQRLSYIGAPIPLKPHVLTTARKSPMTISISM